MSDSKLRSVLGRYALTLVLALVGGLLGAALYQAVLIAPTPTSVRGASPTTDLQTVHVGAGVRGAGEEPGSFAVAAERGKASVVFIRTVTNQPRRGRDDFWSFFDFYGNRGPIASAGSGVVLTEDGYIVTNNHVVERADQIEVSLPNKHTYPAEVVGRDPSTDLALLKINTKDLTPIAQANSDSVRIGDWVLAVGNPFSLTYTVTAGIVSAKGRNINIVNDQFPIESFIQTDAAINPGNSGGALINLRGELIGINTAIATRTGAYSGYGFAIPANIVLKVMDDLRRHGSVQQAFLGAEVVDIDNALGEKLGVDDYSGVYVERVFEEGAANDAGLQVGDVIAEVGGAMIESKAHFLEQVSLYSPGDKVPLGIRRGGATRTLTVTLLNEEGGTGVLKNRTVSSEVLGADVTPLSKLERQTLGIENGYRLTNIRRGRIAQMQVAEGFVLLAWNGYVPASVPELEKLVSGAKGRITLEGITPEGSRVKYSFYSY